MKKLITATVVGLLVFIVAGPGSAEWLKQSTATQVAIGPFVDGTDGVTAETGLTVTAWDCDLFKHADSGMAATALTITASGGSNDAAHMQSGMYSLELTATDTGTTGRLRLVCDHATPTTFVPVFHEWLVVDGNTWESLIDDSEDLTVDLVAGAVDSTSVGTLNSGDLGVGVFATGAITNDASAMDGSELTVNITDGGITDAKLAGGLEIVFETDFATNYNTTRNAWVTNYTDTIGTDPVAAYDGPTNAEMEARTLVAASYFDPAADTVATVTDVTNLHASAATSAELAKVPKSDGTATWNATALQSIQDEAEDAIEADGLDHLVSASVTGTDVTDNSIIAYMVADDATADWDTFNNTTDSLEAIRNEGDASWGAAGTGLSTTTGTAQTAAHSTTALILASGAVTHDDNFKYQTLTITNGDCANQTRPIISSTASTDTVTVTPAFTEGGTCSIDVDFDGATYEIAATSAAMVAQLDEDDATIDLDATTVGTVTDVTNGVSTLATGTAQACGGCGTDEIQLASAQTEVDDIFIGATIILDGGTGAGQTRCILDWDQDGSELGQADTAQVDSNWTTAPDATTTYEIAKGVAGTCPSTVADAADTILAADCSNASATNDTLGAICTDWEDAGRLDAILDARMAEASINTTAGAIDTVTTTVGVTNDVGVNEWNGVALGTTNPLPNAAAGAAGGIPIDTTGGTTEFPTNFEDLNITNTTGLVRADLDNSSGTLSDAQVDDITVGSVTADVGVDEWNGVALSTTNPLPNAADGASGGLPTLSAELNVMARLDQDVVHGGGTTTTLKLDNTGGTGPGFHVIGGGSGAGVRFQGDTTGGTGSGLRIDGGATSGDAIDLVVTSGNYIDVNSVEMADGTSLTEAGGTGDQLTALATAAALATAQSDLDTITGADGTTLATTQGNYAPLKPTTAGRTLDINATGEVAPDFDAIAGTLDSGEIGANAITSSHIHTNAAQEITDELYTFMLNCEVNTANFAGDSDEFACILTDRDGGAVTQASNDLEGKPICITSGDQNRECRYIIDSTWDAGNSELQFQVDRALPATLADAVTAEIR